MSDINDLIETIQTAITSRRKFADEQERELDDIESGDDDGAFVRLLSAHSTAADQLAVDSMRDAELLLVLAKRIADLERVVSDGPSRGRH